MTCNQLGGACDMEFKANSFEEIVAMSKKHGINMFQSGDKAHLRAMSEAKQMMKSPEAMAAWFDNKRKEYEALPEKK